MKIKVRYFASVREGVGRDAEELELPAGVTTVSGLRRLLRDRGGAWDAVLDEKRLVRFAVNQEMTGATATIKPGDEVAFFPPVTGG